MNPNPFYNTYKNKEIDGAQPAEQIAILLEKAATHGKNAQTALSEKNMEDCYFYCEKIRTIITGLAKCLSHETPEQEAMAKTLRDYYGMLEKLTAQIVSHQDISSCEALIRSLYEMASTWRQIAHTGIPQTKVGGQERQPETENSLNFSA